MRNFFSTALGVFFGGFAVVLSSIIATVLLILVFSRSSKEPGKEIDLLSKKDLTYDYILGNESSKNLIAEVDVTGIILGSKREESSPFSSLQNQTFGYQVKDLMRKLKEDPEVKGVLFVFQTPGGTIFGARAIHDAIEDYKKSTNKPVYAFIEGMSASGGVLAMVSANKIFADYGSLVGSIGVIGAHILYFDGAYELNQGLLGAGIKTKNGIKSYVVSAGRSKDLGNPFREPTAEELNDLNIGINNEYENFVNHVAKFRKISKETIKDRMGAMIFDNKRAKELGLIDDTKTYEESASELAKESGLTDNDWKLVKVNEKKNPWLRLLSGELGKSDSKKDYLLSEKRCNSLIEGQILAYHGNPLTICK